MYPFPSLSLPPYVFFVTNFVSLCISFHQLSPHIDPNYPGSYIMSVPVTFWTSYEQYSTIHLRRVGRVIQHDSQQETKYRSFIFFFPVCVSASQQIVLFQQHSAKKNSIICLCVFKTVLLGYVMWSTLTANQKEKRKANHRDVKHSKTLPDNSTKSWWGEWSYSVTLFCELNI